jgi:hypothetical protein
MITDFVKKNKVETEWWAKNEKKKDRKEKNQ